jgi:hypothetical protein
MVPAIRGGLTLRSLRFRTRAPRQYGVPAVPGWPAQLGSLSGRFRKVSPRRSGLLGQLAYVSVNREHSGHDRRPQGRRRQMVRCNFDIMLPLLYWTT